MRLHVICKVAPDAVMPVSQIVFTLYRILTKNAYIHQHLPICLSVSVSLYGLSQLLPTQHNLPLPCLPTPAIEAHARGRASTADGDNTSYLRTDEWYVCHAPLSLKLL